VKFTIGTHSDDLVDMNGEASDLPPGTTVTFTLPSGETVVATADYGSGWEISIELPEGTTSKIDLCTCCDDEDCYECENFAGCKVVCAEHGEDD
jgi:hypothetical protein